jgi:hypothetical protein
MERAKRAAWSSNAAPFERLRTWNSEHETLTSEDTETYLKAVSYLGLMYTGIREKFDSSNATARRIMAMSSLLPDRWTELLEQHRPRALSILVQVLACGELIAKDNFWFRGVARKQIPRLCEHLPPAWWQMVAWPLRVVDGHFDGEPIESTVELDVLLGVQTNLEYSPRPDARPYFSGQSRRSVLATFSPKSRPLAFGLLRLRCFCSTLHFPGMLLFIMSVFLSIFPRMRTGQRIGTAPNEPSAVFAPSCTPRASFRLSSFCDSTFR